MIYRFNWKRKDMVLTTTDLCLNLNRSSEKHQIPGKIAQSRNLPLVTRLILVASGTISRDGEGRRLVKDDFTPEPLELSKNEN